MLLEFQLTFHPQEHIRRLVIFNQLCLISIRIHIQCLSRFQQIAILFRSWRIHPHQTLKQGSHYPILFFTRTHVKFRTKHTSLDLFTVYDKWSMFIMGNLEISFTRQIDLAIRTPERIMIN